MKLLSELQQTLMPDIGEPLTSLPSMSIGGWGGWQHAVGSALLLQNTAGESITSYCLLDSDYWTDHDISERYEEARRAGVQLHVWRRKEIENYLLVPAAIARYIAARITQGAEGPDTEIIRHELIVLAGSLWNETFDAFAATLLAKDRRLGAGGVNKRIREILASWCPNDEDRLLAVSGKRLISALSAWSQERYSVGISIASLARSLGQSEINPEIGQVLAAIAHRRALPAWQPRQGAS